VTTVTGRLNTDGFAIDGPRGHERLAPCVMSFAYWNPLVLKQTHLLNVQTGAWTPVTVQELGKEQIEIRGNSSQRTTSASIPRGTVSRCGTRPRASG